MYENIKETRGAALFLKFVVDGILNLKCILQYWFKGSAVAQWYSA